jgi:hypothetical protein
VLSYVVVEAAEANGNKQDKDYAFDTSDFDLVFSAIRAGRSLAASYNLQSDIQRMYFQL